jgi:hypothetical protein
VGYVRHATCTVVRWRVQYFCLCHLRVLSTGEDLLLILIYMYYPYGTGLQLYLLLYILLLAFAEWQWCDSVYPYFPHQLYI